MYIHAHIITDIVTSSTIQVMIGHLSQARAYVQYIQLIPQITDKYSLT